MRQRLAILPQRYRIGVRRVLAPAMILCAMIASTAIAAGHTGLDDNPESWRLSAAAAGSTAEQIDGRQTVAMTCDFSAAAEAQWSRTVALDLSKNPGIQFDLYCPDPTAIKGFAVRLGDSDGSFVQTITAGDKPGWRRVTLTKSGADIQGERPDWADIRALTVAAVKGAGNVAVFHMAGLNLLEPDPMIQLVRPLKRDSVDLTLSGLVHGRLVNDEYALTTRFGRFTFAADRVVGVSAAGQVGSNVRILLTDGQIVGGSLVDPEIKIALPIGEVMKVSVRRMKQCAYMISPIKPEYVMPTGPTMTVGDCRIAFAMDKDTAMRVRTAHGTVEATPATIASVDAVSGGAGLHRVTFRNGTVLIGELEPTSIKVQLLLNPKEPTATTLGTRQIRRLQWPGWPNPATDEATVYMDKGQKVVGRFAQDALTVKSQFGPRPVKVSEIMSLTLSEIDTGAVTVELWNHVQITGRLLDKTIAFAPTGSETTLQLRMGHIRWIRNTGALPAAQFVIKIERLIRKLDSGADGERQAAMRELIRCGQPAVPVLKKHLGDDSPTLRQQLRDILAKIG